MCLDDTGLPGQPARGAGAIVPVRCLVPCLPQRSFELQAKPVGGVPASCARTPRRLMEGSKPVALERIEDGGGIELRSPPGAPRGLQQPGGPGGCPWAGPGAPRRAGGGSCSGVHPQAGAKRLSGASVPIRGLRSLPQAASRGHGQEVRARGPGPLRLRLPTWRGRKSDRGHFMRAGDCTRGGAGDR